MLASTVQFSSYDQSLHDPHRQPRTPLPTKRTGRYDEHEALRRRNTHPRSQERPVPSGPNSVPTTGPTPPPRSPPTEAGRTSSDNMSPAELVSVPPSSSVTNTRASPRRRHFTIRARLWTTITKTGASAP